MLKRICALALILSVMMVAAPVMSVSAAYTSRWTDNFEEGTVGAVANSSGDYYASAKIGEENGLFIQPNVSSWSTHLTVEPTMGYNGSAGLHMHADTSTHNSGNYRLAAIMTRPVTLTDATNAVYRYKVKFNDVPSGSSFYLSVLTTGTQGVSQGRSGISARGAEVSSVLNISAGQWYTFVTKVTGAAAKKATSSYILDDNGNVVYSTTKDVTVGAADSPMYFWPVYIVGDLTAEAVRLVIDDVSLTEYTAATEQISLDAAASSIADGATDVGIGESLRLTFDQEIASDAAQNVELYRKDDAEKTPVAVTVSSVTFDGFTVKPDGVLETGAEYVLDFSGVTNSAGLAPTGTGTIAFTTSSQAAEPVSYASASITDGQTDVGLQEAISVNFDKEILLPAADTDVTLYETADETKTIGLSVALTADGKGFTVTPSAKLSLGTSYTLSFSGVKSTLYGELAEDSTKSLTFTTIESREAIFVEDDLESATESGYVSSVLDGTYTIEAGSGYESSYGVSAQSKTVQSLKYDLDDSETLFFEFKLKIGEVTEDGVYFGVNGAAYSRCIFRISKDSEGVYYLADAGLGSQYYYAPGEWYTMVWKVKNSGQNGYLFNSDGEKVFDVSQTIAAQHMPGTAYFAISKIGKTTFDIKLDDFKVYRVQADALALDSDRSSVYSGSAGFMPGRSITLAFNQPLSVNSAEAEGAAKLYCGSTEVAATVSRIGGNEIRIVPTEKLEDGTEYTIKLSGLGALSGNTSAVPAEFTFTTRETYPVKVTGTSLAISGGSVSAGEYTVSFQNSGNDAVSGVLVAAFYTDNRLSELKSLAVLGTQSVGSGASTVTVSLAGGYENVGRVELLLYDSLTNLTPLMHAYRITE